MKEGRVKEIWGCVMLKGGKFQKHDKHIWTNYPSADPLEVIHQNLMDIKEILENN